MSSGVLRAGDEAPMPPPKPRKTTNKLLTKIRRSDGKKNKSRYSQYVDPVVQGDDPNASVPGSRLDVIDQLDISVTSKLVHEHQRVRGPEGLPPEAYQGGKPKITERLQSYVNDQPQRAKEAFDSAADDSANPNAEFFGVASEPWQDFNVPSSNGNRYRYERGGMESGRSSRSSNFADMETYLRGDNRTPQTSQGSGDAYGETEYLDSRPYPQSAQRSKSLLGRLRRLKVDPEEAAQSSQGATSLQVERSRTLRPSAWRSGETERSAAAPPISYNTYAGDEGANEQLYHAASPYGSHHSRGQNVQIAAPMPPPKQSPSLYQDASTAPSATNTKYTNTVPLAEPEKLGLGRSRSFFSRIVNRSRGN
ncbi:hypothetical protein MVES_000958 [Malassezia vespertilionis]|uniref:Uncharacterized protein n=1 Tax=Malassezia vespertilionis TaxID=2020962 RepID=A0A2N1JFJ0_9BASI|nr:hypothetical protein MVES_000958 [Malassezia vespertilionis]